MPTHGAISTLIVEPAPADASFLSAALVSGGFSVASVEGFGEARAWLEAAPPVLLIAESRLGAYNGLHLVLHARSIRPNMAAIVISHVVDPVLQAEAERLGATYVEKPVTRADLLAAVFRTLARKTGGAAEPIVAPFERRVHTRRAHVAAPVHEERRRQERRREVAVLIQQYADAQ